MQVRFPSPLHGAGLFRFNVHLAANACRPPCRMVLPEAFILLKTDFRTQLCQPGRLAGNPVFHPNRRSLQAGNASSIASARSTLARRWSTQGDRDTTKAGMPSWSAETRWCRHWVDDQGEVPIETAGRFSAATRT